MPQLSDTDRRRKRRTSVSVDALQLDARSNDAGLQTIVPALTMNANEEDLTMAMSETVSSCFDYEFLFLLLINLIFDKNMSVEGILNLP
jgi:hypothetical protein